MMRDCGNAEMRDLLPELLHARLGPAERASVERHVAGCDDCAAELGLLRQVQSSLAHGSAVDVSRIVSALPRAGTRARAARRTGWRIAAGIAAVLLGAVSVRLAQQESPASPAPVEPGIVASSPVAGVAASPGSSRAESLAAASRRRASLPRTARETAPALTPAGGLADLSDAELELLLGGLDGLTGLPDAEPDADVSPVAIDEGVS